MKLIADRIGVARSHLHDKVHRAPRPRGPYRKPEDDILVQMVRRLVDEGPTYCYRRITAPANRERAKAGRAGRQSQTRLSDHVPEQHSARQTHRSQDRPCHDGKVIVMRSTLRWCSDGFEISCWNGDVIRIAFHHRCS